MYLFVRDMQNFPRMSYENALKVVRKTLGTFETHEVLFDYLSEILVSLDEDQFFISDPESLMSTY
jgi:hypothetical protein